MRFLIVKESTYGCLLREEDVPKPCENAKPITIHGLLGQPFIAWTVRFFTIRSFLGFFSGHTVMISAPLDELDVNMPIIQVQDVGG